MHTSPPLITPTTDGLTSPAQASRPLVSVIIPTYNRGPLLPKAIESALKQEGVGELFDVEVIVVDDCSPTDMSPIVAQFPTVRFQRLPNNRGAAGARNAGIRSAKGAYVALLDDDDEFLTHKLMIQVPILNEHPEIGVVYGQSVVTGTDSRLLLWPEWGPSGRVFETFLTMTDDFLHPPTWLVRRELFEAAGWFTEAHRTMEHYDMALRLASLTEWKFVEGGPVARGRFSKSGKWYTNIANGTNEARLPTIIEQALARLPAGAEADAVRRKARAAVCATITGQRWWHHGSASAKTYLLSALQQAPWLAQEPAVIQWLERMAGGLATTTDRPEQAIRLFWHDIEQARERLADHRLASDKQLLGSLLAAAAVALQPGSPRRAWMVAGHAVLADPHLKRMAELLRQLRRAPTTRSSTGPATT